MINQEELLEYLQVNAAFKSQAIPNKGTFTFVSKITGIPQIWTLDENKEPVQYIKTEDRPLSIHHSPNGEMTAIGMDEKGNEKQQIYLYDQKHDKVEKLVESLDHFHYIGGWSPDGQYISYSSNRRQPGFFDVFIVDIATKEVKEVYRYDGNCTPLSWIDQDHLLISISESNIDSAIYRLNINTKEKTRIGVEHNPARYQSLVMMKNKEGGYVLTDFGEETLYVSRFTFEHPDKLEKLLHWEKWDIEELKKSPNEEYLALTVNEGGISRLWLYHPESNEKEYVNGIPEGVIESISWLNPDEFIFTLKTPTIPGDIWKYTLSSKEVKRLTRISQSELISQNGKNPKICTYQSFDQLEVPYFYYSKDDDKNKPAVIYIHGGPEGQTKADFNPVIQFLVQQGFAVAAPNVRGSNGYGRSYIQLDDARKRMDSVRDLEWLVKDLIYTHGVDSENIGIMGRSYGGFMVLAALTHYPDLWSAGVDIVGISHLKTMLENTGEWRRRLRECEYGFLNQDSAFFDEIAPLNHSHKIKAPLFVFHGRNDTRVPVNESVQIVEKMKAHHQEVDLIIFEDEGHQTERLENHLTMHKNTIEFFTKHLMSSKQKKE